MPVGSIAVSGDALATPSTKRPIDLCIAANVSSQFPPVASQPTLRAAYLTIESTQALNSPG